MWLDPCHQNLPILGPQIWVPPNRPKLRIYMNSNFFTFAKTKTCIQITADTCFIKIYNRKRQLIFTGFPQQVSLCIDQVV